MNGNVKIWKIVVDSRVPISIVKERIKYYKRLEDNLVRQFNPKTTVIVDPQGEYIGSLSIEPKTLVVCYDECKLQELPRIKVIGLPSLTYEAIAAIYAFYIRSKEPTKTIPHCDNPLPPRDLLYLSRKILESVQVFDNYYVLEPSAIANVVKKLLSRYGLLAYPHKTVISFDNVNGSMMECIVVEVYNKALNKLYESIVKVKDRLVEITIPSLGEFKAAIYPEESIICTCRIGCISGESQEERIAEIPCVVGDATLQATFSSKTSSS